MTEVEQIQRVLRERGWCQICANGFFYNTVGNGSIEGIATEEQEGWELVGVFAKQNDMALVSDPSVRPNRVVFRKPAPAYFSSENPWVEKGALLWLPDLTIGENDELANYLSNAGGHGGPGIARRFQCACGEQKVICSYNADNSRASAQCPKCHWQTLLSDVQNQGDDVQVFSCKCGEEHVVIDFGLEYSVDAVGGWDFSWVTVAATCSNCGESAVLFSTETA